MMIALNDSLLKIFVFITFVSRLNVGVGLAL